MPEPLRLRKPVTPFTPTQKFGENLTCIDKARATCITTTGTCPPGFEPLYALQGMQGHNGLDLKTEHKQPVYAVLSGRVSKVTAEPNRGVGIEIISSHRHLIEDRPFRIKTRYWHLFAYGVLKSQKVEAGQLIGWADSTGLSTGDHLHFELKPVRRNWRGAWVNVFHKNGYFGAIDPYPYFLD